MARGGYWRLVTEACPGCRRGRIMGSFLGQCVSVLGKGNVI